MKLPDTVSKETATFFPTVISRCVNCWNVSAEAQAEGKSSVCRSALRAPLFRFLNGLAELRIHVRCTPGIRCIQFPATAILPMTKPLQSWDTIRGTCRIRSGTRFPDCAEIRFRWKAHKMFRETDGGFRVQKSGSIRFRFPKQADSGKGTGKPLFVKRKVLLAAGDFENGVRTPFYPIRPALLSIPKAGKL